MYNLQILEERIVELAKKQGLSKNKLLINAHLTKSLFDNMKKGQIPSVEKIHILADYLDCSVDYLLGRTDCPDLIVKGKNGEPIIIEMMAPPEKTHKIKIAASDGSITEATVTDSDIKKIDALPDADDI